VIRLVGVARGWERCWVSGLDAAPVTALGTKRIRASPDASSHRRLCFGSLTPPGRFEVLLQRRVVAGALKFAPPLQARAVHTHQQNDRVG
jgi:hypothetical protein